MAAQATREPSLSYIYIYIYIYISLSLPTLPTTPNQLCQTVRLHLPNGHGMNPQVASAVGGCAWMEPFLASSFSSIAHCYAEERGLVACAASLRHPRRSTTNVLTGEPHCSNLVPQWGPCLVLVTCSTLFRCHSPIWQECKMRTKNNQKQEEKDPSLNEYHEEGWCNLMHPCLLASIVEGNGSWCPLLPQGTFNPPLKFVEAEWC